MSINISEVAHLRAKITAEYEAMKAGLTGLAAGGAKHAFIAHKMEQVGALQDQLACTIGENKAQELACTTYLSVFSEQ